MTKFKTLFITLFVITIYTCKAQENKNNIFSEENQWSITQIVFVCRLCIDDDSNKYYPHTYVGNDRYMGIKMPIWEGKITGFKNMDGALFPPKPTEYADFYYKNVRIDTIEGLMDWGKEYKGKL